MTKISNQTSKSRLWLIILAGMIFRLILIVFRYDELTQDRDAYWGIANNLMQGVGFCTSGTNLPTAFRPPLYPMLLAIFTLIAGTLGIIFLHLACGSLTIWAVVKTAQKLSLTGGAYLAGLFVALDPMLLRYTTLAMTEVTFTSLVALLLFLWVQADQKPSRKVYLIAGICFGVAVLCRASLLPMLLVVWVLLLANDYKRIFEPDRVFKNTLSVFLIGVAAMLILLPWGIRNYAQFGTFKLTTTHGGYTLLLGNNPVFYDAVVRQPSGTTWGDYGSEDPRSQTQWINQLNQKLDKRALQSETQRDAAQYEIAYKNITAEPLTFLRACLLRQRRFWSPVPIGPQIATMNPAIYWGTGLFYLCLYALAILGGFTVWKLSSHHKKLWLPGIAIILTFACVHSFYWSNARMRAPLVPVIAMLAGLGLEKRRSLK